MDKCVTSNLWVNTSVYPQRYPVLENNISADVAIVGGGFTGISTAYHLQQLGIRAVVAEQHTVGWGASGRNGGMLNTGYKLPAATLIKKFGVETAKRLDNYANASIATVRGLIEKHNIDCRLRHSGHIGLSRSSQAESGMRKTVDLVSRYFGRELDVLTGHELRNEIASDYFSVGLRDPESYQFHPLDYVRGLAAEAIKMGASIFENTKVTSIDKVAEGFAVGTDLGSIRADALVYATDGYSEKLDPALHQGIFPLASYLVATEILDSDLIKSLIPRRINLYDNYNLTNYFRVTPDNRIMLGGSGILKRPKRAYKQELETMLTAIFPHLDGIRTEYFWGGIIGATIDQFPVIGTASNGAIYSVGYTGHGAAQSTMHGKMMARRIAGKERELRTFEEVGLKKLPLYRQKELFVYLANMYFRFMDKFK